MVTAVSFDLQDDELKKIFPQNDAKKIGLHFNDDVLFEMAKKLAEADACFHNGQLLESISLASSIPSVQVDRAEDVELQVLLQLRIARACGRSTMYDEALSALGVATQLLKRQSMFFHDLNVKVELARAKIFFDRGFLQQASAILESLPMHDCRDMHTLAQYHNLAGLFIHRRLRMDRESGVVFSSEMLTEWLYSSLAHYQRGLVSHLFLNDYHGVQASCFNIGNLFAFIHKQHLLPEKNIPTLEQAIHWLSLSEVICNKQGVGGESVWAMLVLVDIGISNSIPLEKLKEMTANLFQQFSSYLHIAKRLYVEAENIGNRLEIAESLQMLARLFAQEGDMASARDNAEKAMDLYLELGRKDMVCDLKKLLERISPSMEGRK